MNEDDFTNAKDFRLVNADFAGYVYRLSKKWKRRFLVLEGRQLSYFGSEEMAMDASIPPKGTIQVCAAYHWTEVNSGLMIISATGEMWKCYYEMTNAGEMILPALARITEKCRAVADNRDAGGDLIPASEVVAIRHCCNANAVEDFKRRNLSIPLRVKDHVTRGWVEKRGSFVQSWKRRYFVLRENVLAYYDINLEGQTKKGGDIVVSINNYAKRANGLEFNMASGRCLVGCTETTEDHVQWLMATNYLSPHEP
ncbi:hypothetical protein THRCLA_06006 [Thraustotheca clavata]|uniref:PH domain-containing protein n=1 Tax=Thraustotheca clavata TaxID=74557 RepID=A0A1V9ZQT4_9STRA|nr:hypothetical protein THRCLA_06006 [Thraustotheca clavata]